jgi:hypothetical protein
MSHVSFRSHKDRSLLFLFFSPEYFYQLLCRSRFTGELANPSLIHLLAGRLVD